MRSIFGQRYRFNGTKIRLGTTMLIQCSFSYYHGEKLNPFWLIFFFIVCWSVHNNDSYLKDASTRNSTHIDIMKIAIVIPPLILGLPREKNPGIFTFATLPWKFIAEWIRNSGAQLYVHFIDNYDACVHHEKMCTLSDSFSETLHYTVILNMPL